MATERRNFVLLQIKFAAADWFVVAVDCLDVKINWVSIWLIKKYVELFLYLTKRDEIDIRTTGSCTRKHRKNPIKISEKLIKVNVNKNGFQWNFFINNNFIVHVSKKKEGRKLSMAL